jgi:predicted dehydrogenase
MSESLKIGVIGCGYWGPLLVRNFNMSRFWDIQYVCDQDPGQLEKIKGNYQAIKVVDDHKMLFNDPQLDAIAIATPVSTHYDLAKQSLLAGKHTWVEKPLAYKSEQVEELIDISNQKNIILHVDHTFIYTPAVRKIREILQNGVLGEFFYFDSVRVNLGLFQHDVNVIWDLAPHDFSILKYVIGKKPKSVTASGKCHIKYSDKKIENIAYITVNFDDDSIAHFHLNWLSPVKIRQILIGGSKKMLIFNDLEPIEKIKIYDSGVDIKTPQDFYDTLLQYRTGDMYSPKVENRKALEMECEHFYECIMENKHTDTSGKDGLYVVKLLEASNESLRKGGELVEF